MKISHLAKSIRTQKLTSGLTAIVCLVLASFIVRVPSASADTFTCAPSTQHPGASRVFTQESAERFDELRNKILYQEAREGTISQKQAQYWQEVREASGWVSRLDFAHNYVDHPYVGHEIIINATDDWCYDPVRSLIYLTVAEAEALKPVVEKRGEDRKENLRKAAEIRRRIRERQQQQQQQTTVETESTITDDKPDTSSEPAETDPPTEHTDNPKTQSESETTSSSPNNHNYRTPLPLITSRPLSGPSSTRPETTEESDIQAEPEAAPQPDQNQPVETDSGNIDSVDEPQAPEVVTSPPSEVTTAILLDVTPTDPPIGQSGDPTQISSGTSNARPVLWGIVAAMSTLLVLGSLIFRSQDRE